MNDVIWYSRFAVLVGALVLLVQAAAGRGTSLVTLIGILLLCVGFLVFITGLSLQGLGWSPGSGRPASTSEPEEPLVVPQRPEVDTARAENSSQPQPGTSQE